MIKRYTKISLLWVSMVCGSLFGSESIGISRKPLSETFQTYIRSYPFIPHTKREAGFFAAGTVGMGYLWALRSESVPGYVKCILVAPPAVIATHFAARKLGLFQERPKTSEYCPKLVHVHSFPTVAELTKNQSSLSTSEDDALTAERRDQFNTSLKTVV